MNHLIEQQNDECVVYRPNGEVLLALMGSLQPVYGLDKKSIYCFEYFSEVSFNRGEEYGYGNPFLEMDEQCMRKLVLCQLKHGAQFVKQYHQKVSFNVDLEDLSNNEFVAELLELSSDNLILELNGYYLDSSEAPAFISNIKALKRRGVELWLDAYDPRNPRHNQFLKLKLWDGVKLNPDFSITFTHNKAPLSLFAKLRAYVEKIILTDVTRPAGEQSAQINQLYSQGNYYGYPTAMGDMEEFFISDRQHA